MRFMIVCMLFLANTGFANMPARMAVFQTGPVGYGQAFLKRSRVEAEGLMSQTQMAGREDSALTDLTGETQITRLSGEGYLQMSDSFYFLLGLHVNDFRKDYSTANSIYQFKSNYVAYTFETGAHIDKGHLSYGSKISLNILGEESREIRDAITDVKLTFPEAEVPYLKFWVALVGTHSKLGLTLHTHNKKSVNRDYNTDALTVNEDYSRGTPARLMLDLSMKNTEATTLAFGLHLTKRGQGGDAVIDTSNVNIASDRFKPLNGDQWELLVGNEYKIREFFRLYSSLVYGFKGYTDEQYSSIVQDNTGGTELNSTLLIARENREYQFGLSYRLANPVVTKAKEDSGFKTWAGSGSDVKVSQVRWALTFSLKAAL